MKKMLIFGGIIIVLFAAMFAVAQMENKNTAKQEKNYYTNKISSSDIRKNNEEKKEQTIYFYQTDCHYCEKVSPIVVPMAKDMNIDMKVIDILNDNPTWDDYKIEGTPTIIHFKDGKEVSRISGEQPKDNFEKWFKENKK
ncbi:thiol reductase thioredoxin [Bacillus pseudomycoides]|jgi:thioredoxin-related protein|uniref:Thioredoxin family protein n=2 Tax=Bacillus pseudomycoides TaxID=64104 RepID=A0AAJ1Z1G5_9BACI|nr:thioredoxin family protein [Bacillus pseudomycoides]EEM06756.1 Thioredoxin [Bacillus pseudomycoides]EEM12533.1 Thioredoxin [Bacillus pseudomycoides]MBD5796426.1 thiol reductase thioredoxin [Bacillus pseudomycoides]MCR8860047.1 thioredoxin family protein [Bacillus pseudomycoides]MDR4327106.1 thioredoxin family protein [Bacillus pseudomycoides]